MTPRENKVIWKLARNIYLGGFLLWITETIFFFNNRRLEFKSHK
jgi:hypothetical protein